MFRPRKVAAVVVQMTVTMPIQICSQVQLYGVGILAEGVFDNCE